MEKDNKKTKGRNFIMCVKEKDMLTAAEVKTCADALVKAVNGSAANEEDSYQILEDRCYKGNQRNLVRIKAELETRIDPQYEEHARNIAAIFLAFAALALAFITDIIQKLIEGDFYRITAGIAEILIIVVGIYIIVISIWEIVRSRKRRKIRRAQVIVEAFLEEIKNCPEKTEGAVCCNKALESLCEGQYRASVKETDDPQKDHEKKVVIKIKKKAKKHKKKNNKEERD